MIDIREKSQHGQYSKGIGYTDILHLSKPPFFKIRVKFLAWRSCTSTTIRFVVTAQMIDFTGIYPQCGGRSTHFFRNQVNCLGIIDHRLVPSSSMGACSGEWNCSITNVVLAVWWVGDNIGITSIYTPEIQP